ncbi:MAG: hypothetical protein AAF720_13965, partial [Pseudomonadota bacterium]
NNNQKRYCLITNILMTTHKSKITQTKTTWPTLENHTVFRYFSSLLKRFKAQCPQLAAHWDLGANA